MYLVLEFVYLGGQGGEVRAGFGHLGQQLGVAEGLVVVVVIVNKSFHSYCVRMKCGER